MRKETISSGVSNSFAIDLLTLEMDAHPGANVLLSPLSVSLSVGMMLNGSRGKARQEAASALGFGTGRSLRGINESYSRLREALAATTEVDLDIASNLVAGKGASIKKNFLNKSAQYFDARISLLDLNDPAAVVLMNSFICQKTKGKIPSILDGLDDPDNSQLILLNAFFFHGFWKKGFDRLLTQEEQFERLDGSKTTCALMYRRGSFLVSNRAKFQAVKLPYGQSGRFAMYAFLPRAEGASGLQSALQAMAQDGLNQSFKGFLPGNGELFLPRCRTGYTNTLNDSLRQLGMGDAFGSEADFASLLKGRSPQRLTLQHKTVVEINENSAEEQDGKKEPARLPEPAIMCQRPFSLRFDRPFCFFVRDEETASITVAGFINDPSR